MVPELKGKQTAVLKWFYKKLLPFTEQCFFVALFFIIMSFFWTVDFFFPGLFFFSLLHIYIHTHTLFLCFRPTYNINVIIMSFFWTVDFFFPGLFFFSLLHIYFFFEVLPIIILYYLIYAFVFNVYILSVHAFPGKRTHDLGIAINIVTLIIIILCCIVLLHFR